MSRREKIAEETTEIKSATDVTGDVTGDATEDQTETGTTEGQTESGTTEGQTESEADDGKTRIKPDTSKYVKGPDGKMHTDDVVGHGLAGMDLDQVKTVGKALGIDVDKYDHLNVGQRRMNIGNKIRGVLKHKDNADGGKTEDFNLAVEKIREQIAATKAEAEKAKVVEKAA